jgi:hypothetical protein
MPRYCALIVLIRTQMLRVHYASFRRENKAMAASGHRVGWVPEPVQSAFQSNASVARRVV